MKLPKGKLVNLRRGRPTIHSKKHDNLVKKFLKATRYKGGIVNSSIAIAKAKELTKRYPLPEKDNLELGISWTNFMAFSREQALHDARQLLVRSQYLLVLKKNQSRNSCTNSWIRVRNIKFHFHWWEILNQTSSKYIQVSSNTMEMKGVTNIPIPGTVDKRSITATFSITLERNFIPMH